MDTKAIVSIVQYDIEQFIQDLYLPSQVPSPTKKKIMMMMAMTMPIVKKQQKQ